MKREKVSRELVDLSSISYSWWKIISGENSKKSINLLFGDIESAIGYSREQLKSGGASQEPILQLILLYSYKSRLHNLNDNRVAGFYAFKQSFDYFKMLKPCNNHACDLYNFVSGMYYALGGHLEEEFPPALLGIDKNYADKEKGYQLLEKSTYSEVRQIRIESTYFLSKLYLELQENPEKASRYTQLLINQFPENLVFRYNHVLALYNQGKINEAETVYQSIMKSARENSQLTLIQKTHFENEYAMLKK